MHIKKFKNHCLICGVIRSHFLCTASSLEGKQFHRISHRIAQILRKSGLNTWMQASIEQCLLCSFAWGKLLFKEPMNNVPLSTTGTLKGSKDTAV